MREIPDSTIVGWFFCAIRYERCLIAIVGRTTDGYELAPRYCLRPWALCVPLSQTQRGGGQAGVSHEYPQIFESLFFVPKAKQPWAFYFLAGARNIELMSIPALASWQSG